MIVWKGKVAAGNLTFGGINPARAGVLRDISSEKPNRRSLGEIGQRVGNDPPPNTCVVADAGAYQYLPPVEQLGLTRCIQDAARPPIGDGSGFQGGASPLGKRPTL